MNAPVMTLTKRELVRRISIDTGLRQTQVFGVVQKCLDQISDVLAKGGKVEFRNFGVFEVRIRKARVGRNPNNPEKDVPIPSRSMVKFKAGKELRLGVLKLTPRGVNSTEANLNQRAWKPVPLSVSNG